MNSCTASRGAVEQPKFVCVTCSHAGSPLTVCACCAERCHSGREHDLRADGSGVFACQCPESFAPLLCKVAMEAIKTFDQSVPITARKPSFEEKKGDGDQDADESEDEYDESFEEDSNDSKDHVGVRQYPSQVIPPTPIIPSAPGLDTSSPAASIRGRSRTRMPSDRAKSCSRSILEKAKAQFRKRREASEPPSEKGGTKHRKAHEEFVGMKAMRALGLPPSTSYRAISHGTSSAGPSTASNSKSQDSEDVVVLTAEESASWYTCKGCGPQEGHSVCAMCARTCHDEHFVFRGGSLKNRPEFACGCGFWFSCRNSCGMNGPSKNALRPPGRSVPSPAFSIQEESVEIELGEGDVKVHLPPSPTKPSGLLQVDTGNRALAVKGPYAASPLSSGVTGSDALFNKCPWLPSQAASSSQPGSLSDTHAAVAARHARGSTGRRLGADENPGLRLPATRGALHPQSSDGSQSCRASVTLTETSESASQDNSFLVSINTREPPRLATAKASSGRSSRDHVPRVDKLPQKRVRDVKGDQEHVDCIESSPRRRQYAEAAACKSSAVRAPEPVGRVAPTQSLAPLTESARRPSISPEIHPAETAPPPPRKPALLTDRHEALDAMLRPSPAGKKRKKQRDTKRSPRDALAKGVRTASGRDLVPLASPTGLASSPSALVDALQLPLPAKTSSFSPNSTPLGSIPQSPLQPKGFLSPKPPSHRHKAIGESGAHTPRRRHLTSKLAAL